MKRISIIIVMTSLAVACGASDKPPIEDEPAVTSGKDSGTTSDALGKDPGGPGPGPGMDGSVPPTEGGVVADGGSDSTPPSDSATPDQDTGSVPDSATVPDSAQPEPDAEVDAGSPLMRPCQDVVGNDCPMGYICRPAYSQSTGSVISGEGNHCTRYCALPQDCPAPSYGCNPFSKCSFGP